MEDLYKTKKKFARKLRRAKRICGFFNFINDYSKVSIYSKYRRTETTSIAFVWSWFGFVASIGVALSGLFLLPLPFNFLSLLAIGLGYGYMRLNLKIFEMLEEKAEKHLKYCEADYRSINTEIKAYEQGVSVSDLKARRLEEEKTNRLKAEIWGRFYVTEKHKRIIEKRIEKQKHEESLQDRVKSHIAQLRETNPQKADELQDLLDKMQDDNYFVL